MIEIEAEILRGSCMPVYFVGETIECEIRFRCLAPPTAAAGSKSSHTANNNNNNSSSSSSNLIKRFSSSSSSSDLGATAGNSTTSTTATTAPATTQNPFVSFFSSKVKYVDLNEAGSSSSPTIVDEKKLNEINQSMFSLLAAYPSVSSISNASSSIATTPTDSIPGF